jgi:hypothetical protein
VNSQQRTFSQDIMRGDAPPSGTPLGTSQLQAAMSGGYFDLKREDVGFFFKEIIWDWVIPKFKNDKSKEHEVNLIALMGNDVDELIEAIVVNEYNSSLPKMIQKGFVPDPNQSEIMKSVIKSSLNSRPLTIPKNFYKDYKFKIDVIITNEQIDLSNKVNAGITVLQMLNNPTILQDPRTERIFYQVTEWMGLPVKRSGTQSIQQSVAQARPGGSISSPQMSMQPQMATNTQAL